MGLLDLHADSLQTAATNTRSAPPPAPTPRFNTWGLATAAPRGVSAGAAEAGGFWADILGAFGQVAGAYPEALGVIPDAKQRKEADEARRKLLTEGTDFSSETGDLFRSVARDYRPDAQTASTAERLVFDFSRFASKAVGYSVAAGPIPGAALTGADEGMTMADDLRQQGVDLATRTKAGAIAGVVAGGSVALPIAGTTVAQTAGLVLAGGPLAFAGQQAATRYILDRAGYARIGEQFDPFDPVGLAVSTLVPAGFGAWALRGRRSGAQTAPDGPDVAGEGGGAHPLPQEHIDAARVHHAMETERAAALSARDGDAIARAADQIGAGERVDVTDFADTVPDVRAIQAAEHMQQAIQRARDMIPVGEARELDVETVTLGKLRPTDTPEFRQWFGESKVVDEDGAPQVVYHGTRSDVAAFDAGRLGEATGADSTGLGFFFTDKVSGEPAGWMAHGAEVWAADREGSYAGGGNVMPVYVSVKNPKTLKGSEMARAHSDPAEAAAIRRQAEAEGHDGFRYQDADENWVIAFRPEQIKSAIGNSGKFDPASPSLTDAPAAAKPDPLVEQVHAAVDDLLSHVTGKPVQRAEPAKAEPEDPHAQSIATRLAEIQQQFPDLQVRMDDGEAMPLKQLLDDVKAIADQEKQDAALFEIAANCHISFGG